jgi:hypothetical protein
LKGFDGVDCAILFGQLEEWLNYIVAVCFFPVYHNCFFRIVQEEQRELPVDNGVSQDRSFETVGNVQLDSLNVSEVTTICELRLSLIVLSKVFGEDCSTWSQSKEDD